MWCFTRVHYDSSRNQCGVTDFVNLHSQDLQACALFSLYIYARCSIYRDREAVQSERSTLLNWSCGEKSCDFLTIRGPPAPFFLPFVASVCNMSFHIRSEVPLVLFVDILCNLCVYHVRNLLLLTCIIPLIACHCDMC